MSRGVVGKVMGYKVGRGWEGEVGMDRELEKGGRIGTVMKDRGNRGGKMREN